MFEKQPLLRFICGLFTAVLIAGCTTTGDAPKQISRVENDQFSKNITIVGGQQYVNPLGGTFRSWLIRTWIDKKTQKVTHQLYVEISYIGEWKYFQMASDDKATSLHVDRISTHVGNCSGGCSLDEAIGISLSDAELRARLGQGYPIKISAKSGDALIIVVSPEQIRLQLEAIDKSAKVP